MHTIAILNHKGGVGKTTTALNVSSFLAERDHRVLLIDLDSQRSASLTMGVPRHVLDERPSSADLLYRQSTVEHACYSDTWENIDLIPASMDIAHAGVRLDTSNDGPWRLHAALNQPDVQSEYDVVVLDCPPSVSVVTLNALLASDSLIVPTAPSYLSLEGLQSLGKVIDSTRSTYNAQISIAGIVLTMMDATDSETQAAAHQLRSHYGKKVFDASIPKDPTLEHAAAHHCSIFSYAPDSKGARGYAALTEEVTQRWKHYDTVLSGIRKASSYENRSSPLM